MNRALVIDLETTGVDTAACEVVQCAALAVHLSDCWREVSLMDWLARPLGEIPRAASDVHKITAERVADRPTFAELRGEVCDHVAAFDPELIITFNGAEFDLPILRRYGIDLAAEIPHFDVFRVWQVAREQKLAPPTCAAAPHANRYTGALGSAYAWLDTTEPYPDREHDAGEDCRMAAAVAQALADWAGLPQCLAWSTGPLPGYADYASKIKIRDGAPVLGFGKHAGESLADVARKDRAYLTWVMRSDFHHSTKKVVQSFLRS